MYRLEQTILKNLIYEESYCRKVLPFLKGEYFSDAAEKHVFEEVTSFLQKYNARPTHEALVINFTETQNLKEEQVKAAVTLLEDIHKVRTEPTDQTWLIDQTEKFCQDKSIYNAVLEAVAILDDTSGKKAKGAIPDLLTKALSVSFDTNIGHDYLDDASDRFDFYHRKEERIPFDLDFFNKITNGGFPKKTLNIIMAGTNVGKSLMLCHFAASYLSQGKNVLYITLEMAEERIAERIDANLLNIALADLQNIPKVEFEKRVGALRNKTNGKLIIKEYPTASASTHHFKMLINELALKKSFRPDVIIVDYLNICASARIKPGTQTNSYYYVKSIAEEMRGMAVEYDVPVISATQTNRTGFNNSDADLTDTSESFGLPMTADFLVVVINTEDLEKLGQFLIKQLKNRYADVSRYKRFVIGVDKSKMRLYDVEQSAQDGVAPMEAKSSTIGQTKFKKDFSSLKV